MRFDNDDDTRPSCHSFSPLLTDDDDAFLCAASRGHHISILPRTVHNRVRHECFVSKGIYGAAATLHIDCAEDVNSNSSHSRRRHTHKKEHKTVQHAKEEEEALFP